MIRRDFLRFAAGGVIGTAASGLGVRTLSRFNAALAAEEVHVPGGPEASASSICWLCPAGCGLRVRTVGGRAVSIQGNRLHPVNRGGLCPKGVAGLQELYHPDRLRKPLKNAGTRTEPRWQEISWDDASNAIAGKLEALRNAGQAHTAAFIDGNERSMRSRVFRRFLAAYGSPNYFAMPSGLEAVQAAIYLQQGVTEPVAFDLDNTRYLLSFGVNLLEGWGTPTAVMRAFGRWRDPSAGRRTKFVQIEPRLSLTAARADEWVPVRPGTEAALALGIAYVLITEDLYDAAFVREHTFGFEDWRDGAGRTHLGFRSLVLADYRLNHVAALTGVPAENILRLAREFADNPPALAIGDHQTSTLPGNPFASMAIHSLNALAGSIGTPGGVLHQAELPPPRGEPARPAAQPHAPVTATGDYIFPGDGLGRLPEAVLSRKPYPVQALFLHQADPIFSMPNGEAFRRALEQVPFLVSFSLFPDESASMADLVLPATTGLESWTGASSPPAYPYVVESVAPAAVLPRYQARNPADVILEIARRLGGPVAAALPFAGFEEYLRNAAEGLFTAQTGYVFTTSLEEAWNRLLERSGWWAPTWSTAEELWEQMKSSGGWWEPAHSFGVQARTPSGRFEFYSQRLAEWGRSRPEFARAAGLDPGDDRLCLPHQPPLKDASEDYPLALLPIEVLPLAGGAGGHLPYLQQIAGPHLAASWESWLEINPETAHKLGIGDGEIVWVESRRGRARVRARTYEGVRPGVVHLPLGYGHAAGSEWGRRGVNPLALLEEEYEPLAGLPQTAGTQVKVYRV